MPVRPRHCNGRSTRARTTDCGREGERRGPEPGDDRRPRHFTRSRGRTGGVAARTGVPGLRGLPSSKGNGMSAFFRALARRCGAAVGRGARVRQRSPRRPAMRCRDDFGDPLRRRRHRPPHRLAESRHDRDPLRVRRRRPAGGAVALRPLPAEAARGPRLGKALRPSVESVLGARPDLVVLYAGDDNRDAARAARRRAPRRRPARQTASPISAAPSSVLGRLTAGTPRRKPSLIRCAPRSHRVRRRHRATSRIPRSSSACLGRAADGDRWRQLS